MSFTWAPIKSALFNYVNDALPDIPADRIIWAKQDLPEREYPSVVLDWASVVTVGDSDETRIRELEDKSGIEFVTVMIREFTFSIEIAVDEPQSNNPDTDAMFLCSYLQGNVGRRSVIEKLSLANLARVETLAVADLSRVVNGNYISRAVLDIRMRTTLDDSETVEYIERVQINSEPGDIDGVAVDIDLNGGTE